MNSMFSTNKKLSLMVAWSSSVSISRFKVHNIGHLVWFFDSGNSIVSGANLWCPYHYCDDDDQGGDDYDDLDQGGAWSQGETCSDHWTSS